MISILNKNKLYLQKEIRDNNNLTDTEKAYLINKVEHIEGLSEAELNEIKTYLSNTNLPQIEQDELFNKISSLWHYNSSEIVGLKEQIEQLEKDLATTKNELQESIVNSTNLIKNAMGGYVIKRENELLIMDTTDVNTAQKVWRWNLNGLGYSNTGYNGSYSTAITMDGHINANFIATGTLKAINIEGVDITGSTFHTKGFWNKDEIKVEMDQGSIHTFSKGFFTKYAEINIFGNYIEMENKTINEVLAEDGCGHGGHLSISTNSFKSEAWTDDKGKQQEPRGTYIDTPRLFLKTPKLQLEYNTKIITPSNLQKKREVIAEVKNGMLMSAIYKSYVFLEWPWENYGTSLNTAKIWIDSSGVTHLEGAIKATGQPKLRDTILTIDKDYAPSENMEFDVICHNFLHMRILVRRDGIVQLVSFQSDAWKYVNLNGITWVSQQAIVDKYV